MPVMDGVTATREIRKLPKWSTLPIVAMTANAMAGDRDRCIEAGMNDHLTKPIDPDRLWSALRRWIKPPPDSRAPLPGSVGPAGSAPAFAAIEPIAGLDATAGLRHSAGREALYLSLLRKFSAGQRDFPARLANALAADDWQTAERLAALIAAIGDRLPLEGSAAIHGFDFSLALDRLREAVAGHGIEL